MKCDRCEKDAQLMIHTIDAHQEKTTLHLCTTCAQELFIKGAGNMDQELFAYFQDNLKHILSGFFEEQEEQKERRCSHCNSTFTDIINSGRFGCDHCYTEFFDKARQTLKMAQGTTKHKGAVPKNFTPSAEEECLDIEMQLIEKQEALEVCIAEEDYEGAAVLRDEMKELQKAIPKE